MALFLYLICLVWLVAGICMLASPPLMRRLQEKILKVKNFKALAAIPLTIGILFLLSADSVFYPTLVQVIGLIAIMKGLTLLSVKQEKVTEMMKWWHSAPELCVRMWGFFVLCFAALVFKSIV